MLARRPHKSAGPDFLRTAGGARGHLTFDTVDDRLCQAGHARPPFHAHYLGATWAPNHPDGRGSALHRRWRQEQASRRSGLACGQSGRTTAQSVGTRRASRCGDDYSHHPLGKLREGLIVRGGRLFECAPVSPQDQNLSELWSCFFSGPLPIVPDANLVLTVLVRYMPLAPPYTVAVPPIGDRTGVCPSRLVGPTPDPAPGAKTRRSVTPLGLSLAAQTLPASRRSHRTRTRPTSLQVHRVKRLGRP